MRIVQFIAQILGLVSAVGAIITVTLPALRRKTAAGLIRLAGLQETAADMAKIRQILEKHVAADELRQKEMQQQKEVDICVLRNLITGIYYQYAPKKKIPLYALRDVSALHDLYHRRGGNSYEGILFRRMTREWEVVATTDKEEV